jgi:cell volume regulation protein A
VTVSLPSDLALAVGAALLVAGVLCAGFADRLRAPGLVLFLALGMVLGTDGLGLIDFADAGLAQSIGVAALVVILYEGGLSTSPGELRRVAGSGLALATVGVVVTALVVAGGTLLVLDVPATTALLIGAVVSSTDAAAVFSVLRPTPLPARLKVLLEAESGGNDPMAVLLTVGFLAAATGEVSTTDWVVFGLRQLVGGLAVGMAVGSAGSWALRRLRLGSPALYPVLASAWPAWPTAEARCSGPLASLPPTWRGWSWAPEHRGGDEQYAPSTRAWRPPRRSPCSCYSGYWCSQPGFPR